MRFSLRGVSVWSSVEAVVQDLRYGLRLMWRSPVLTIVAIGSLSLGIGANTALFSVVNALLIRTLPVSHPEQLVSPAFDSGGAGPLRFWSYPDFVLMRERLRSVSAIAAVAEISRSNMQVDTSPADSEPVKVGLVSGTYFPMLGVAAAQGRMLEPEDDRQPSAHAVAVVSDRFWRQRLARRADVVGRKLTFSETAYTIVGVAPASFMGDWIGHPTDVWVPIAMQPKAMPERPNLLTAQGPSFVRIIARLGAGQTLMTAVAEGNALFPPSLISAPHVRVFSPSELEHAARRTFILEAAARGFSAERHDFGLPLTVAMIIVGVVLLIACANVANLLLARATARGSEVALRIALGAGPGRLFRQLLTESLLLAACAGVLGLGVAAAGTGLLGRLVNSGASGLWLDLHLDWNLLLFTSAVSLGVGLVFGLAPALRASQTSISASLATRGASGSGSAGRFRLAKLLVVGQVALSITLLVAASLFVRTLRNLTTQDMGLDRGHVVVVQTAPDQEGLRGAPMAEVMERLQRGAVAVPGVRSAAVSSSGLLTGVSASPAVVPGYVYGAHESNSVRWNIVTPKYFDTMGMALLAGRDLSSDDLLATPRVAVVNETMARYYWGRVDVVGRHFGLRNSASGDEIEIVGVVRDAKTESLREQPERTAFFPYRQEVAHLWGSLTVVVQFGGAVDDIRGPLREALRTIDPRLPILSLGTVDDEVDRAVATERLIATVASLFSALAAVLTCLGLYGLMSYLTVRRTGEIGIRLALGSTRRALVGLVLRESLSLIVLGIVLAVPASLSAMRMAETALFNVGATDVLTIAETSILMVVVGVIATALPAYRAATVNPMIALRAE